MLVTESKDPMLPTWLLTISVTVAHPQSLDSAGLGSVTLIATGERVLALVPRWFAEAFLSWAANQPVVRWIDERETFQLFNNIAAQGIQSATYAGTPLWSKGLTGAGQVVGVADTVRHLAWRVCVSVCVRVCVRACVRACVRVCVCVSPSVLCLLFAMFVHVRVSMNVSMH
jgi:hypothetical protein